MKGERGRDREKGQRGEGTERRERERGMDRERGEREEGAERRERERKG